jgi:hypothetical protein
MSAPGRLALAAAIVVVDLALFAVPLVALVAAYVIVARPPWFRDWVRRLYDVA